MSDKKKRKYTTNTIKVTQDKKNGTFTIVVTGLPVEEGDALTPLLLAIESVCRSMHRIIIQKIPYLLGSSLTECIVHVREKMCIEDSELNEVSRG